MFSWARMQPSEDKYDFSELDNIVEMLSKENYDIVLAISMGALPAWMAEKYHNLSQNGLDGCFCK